MARNVLCWDKEGGGLGTRERVVQRGCAWQNVWWDEGCRILQKLKKFQPPPRVVVSAGLDAEFYAGFLGSFWVIHGVILKSCTKILREILQKLANTTSSDQLENIALNTSYRLLPDFCQISGRNSTVLTSR